MIIMKQITDVKELHGILLDMGKEFHRICTENSIPYYMLGGTMLGAVRHKGFIPWDDDMDFGVPREHFERLKKVLRKELDKKYSVRTFPESDALLMDIVKIMDNRTVLKELYKENVIDNAINIDIFPLDRAASKEGNCRKINKLMKFQAYRFLSLDSRPFAKKIIAVVVKMLFFWMKKEMVVRYINQHLVESEGPYIANVYGAWGPKETVLSEVMGTPMLYNFEDTQFCGVENSDAYLKSLYSDYMQLPPENNRHLHLLGAYWK